jgi:hypothetical protein
MTQIDRFHWNVELPIQTLSWAVGADLPATLTDDPAEDSDAQNEPRDIDLEKSSNETRGFALLAKWATEASGVGMAECGTVALTACGGEGSCASCPKRAMGIAKLLHGRCCRRYGCLWAVTCYCLWSNGAESSRPSGPSHGAPRTASRREGKSQAKRKGGPLCRGKPYGHYG